jgi:hypothetical protein
MQLWIIVVRAVQCGTVRCAAVRIGKVWRKAEDSARSINLYQLDSQQHITIYNSRRLSFLPQLNA